ncbi:MAG: TIGR02206 family membrane protein [Spirochaetales bacterium]|nr:TIGR02206 family membrane protein [Spirochaetales bacterium]
MPDYFSAFFYNNTFKAFSLSHVAALIVIVIVNIMMVVILKKLDNPKVNKIFCYTVSIVIIVQEIGRSVWYAAYGIFSCADSLPLHLCGFAIILMPFMLIMKNKTVFELLYFWGLAGATQALLTPDLTYDFPHWVYFRFFFAHGLIILGCIYMVFVEKYRPAWKSILKTFIVTNILMLLIAPLNWATGGNYFFMCHKPETGSLLDFLGPWPWYLLSLQGVGLLIFVIYYMPFFIKDLIEGKRRKRTA